MQFVRNILNEQRKRLVGTLMSHIEEYIYPSLTDVQRKELRNKVLASAATYHDVCLDMLKASVEDGTSMVNEEALRVLADLHSEVRQLRKDVGKDVSNGTR